MKKLPLEFMLFVILVVERGLEEKRGPPPPKSVTPIPPPPLLESLPLRGGIEGAVLIKEGDLCGMLLLLLFWMLFGFETE